MSTRIIATLLLGGGLSVTAGFSDDFQAARRLVDRREHEAAHQAFAELAKTAPNAHGRGACVSWAAIVLGRGGHVEQALELAGTIEEKALSAYTQMKVMSASRKHGELIAAFGREAIVAWPDRFNYRGLFLRGTAHRISGNKQAAVKDLQHCVELAGSDLWIKLEALNGAAGLHHALQDDAKALAAYEEALAIFDETPSRKGRWLYPQALLGITRILMAQKNYHDALATLERFSVKPQKDKRGPWDFLVLEAYGDIRMAQGKTVAGLARYRDAATIDTHKSYVDRVRTKIDALDGGHTEANQ
ncbi:MAG: tetratricopeptide repeat protein [Lentisphaerae bacterium]|jgi:tetratricopeptide (TPR) repeat protein|nr:tetratricopeptide repeat protein [Lentisphaerota bacterium]MBT4814339.1 tetratricopeptide repeat protein [Lentisphaerota bacterium]MBT5604454.1 tetratricopeptide repeat protein [Lentisphaerota bacterium]MBT7062194.1 tetratricopeptide repeat protein [Lentisphaerota bacterium]MBT7842321.1 tetratricopeptide repeat protein [Lentisphaerota bacterium]